MRSTKPAADLPVEVLTVRPKVAMQMLGIQTTTFYELVKRGEIPTIRIGRNCTLVPVAGIKAFLARHTGGVA